MLWIPKELRKASARCAGQAWPAAVAGMGPKQALTARSQLVVNVVAVATAAGGALFLRESPLTAVQMVRATLFPRTAVCLFEGSSLCLRANSCTAYPVARCPV